MSKITKEDMLEVLIAANSYFYHVIEGNCRFVYGTQCSAYKELIFRLDKMQKCVDNKQ
jgi:hypothetical protein